MESLYAAYPYLKALHVIAVIAWMAGLLYLPRLFVYHAQTTPGSETSEIFKVMERRLLKYIMNPAMIVSLLVGLFLFVQQELWTSGWMHAKFLLLFGMFAMHGFMGRWRKEFEADRNKRSDKFYRMMNEVPTVLMILIVILAVAKPF